MKTSGKGLVPMCAYLAGITLLAVAAEDISAEDKVISNAKGSRLYVEAADDDRRLVSRWFLGAEYPGSYYEMDTDRHEEEEFYHSYLAVDLAGVGDVKKWVEGIAERWNSQYDFETQDYATKTAVEVIGYSAKISSDYRRKVGMFESDGPDHLRFGATEFVYYIFHPVEAYVLYVNPETNRGVMAFEDRGFFGAPADTASRQLKDKEAKER